MPDTPALIFSLLLASVYATLFHLWKGRRLRDLLFFWLAAVVGFASGQVAGQMLQLVPTTVGQIHIIEATLVAILFLFVARWIMQVQEAE